MKPSQTSVPPARQPRAFSTAATFRLELWGRDVFESYSPPCHRNGGRKKEINEILVGAPTGECVEACGGSYLLLPAAPTSVSAQHKNRCSFVSPNCQDVSASHSKSELCSRLFDYSPPSTFTLHSPALPATSCHPRLFLLTLAYFLSFFFFVKPSLKLISVPAKQRHPNFPSIFLAGVPSFFVWAAADWQQTQWDIMKWADTTMKLWHNETRR